MRLYRIKYEDETLDWAGTQADAKAAAKRHQQEHGDPGITWVEEDVPTDKAALIAWLQANATDTYTGE